MPLPPVPSPAVRPSILLANHHGDTNRAMARILERFGFAVQAVETLADAEALFQKTSFDLFICRIAMPDGSGADAIRDAWTQHATPSLALAGVAASHQAASQISPDALRGIIPIPCEVAAMLQLIHKAIGDARQPCPDCHGAGAITLLIHRKPCSTCSGTGQVRKRRAPRPGNPSPK